MTDPTLRGPRTSLRLVVLALVSALLSIPALLLTAGPASAHTKLVSSNPQDGSSLSAPPTQVVLSFDEVPTVKTVRAQNTDGALVALGDPVQSGATVSVSWPAGTAPGLYRLVYSLVSDDGDPVEGTLIFSYAAGTSTGTSAAATTTTSPTDTTSGTAGTSWSMRAAWLLAVGMLVAAVVALVVLSRRRARSGSLEDGDAPRVRVRADV